MRRSWHGVRTVKVPASVGTRWIQREGIPIFHHKRGNEQECPNCWDEYAETHSPACSTCNGTGYVAEYRRKMAVVTYAQPPGVYGHGDQVVKSGGRMKRQSVYVYLSEVASKDVDEGDRFVIENRGRRSEIIAINKLPIATTQGRSQLVAFECTTPTDQDLADEI